eukprot:3286512-Pyramimonas_sp.AAC.1
MPHVSSPSPSSSSLPSPAFGTLGRPTPWSCKALGPVPEQPGLARCRFFVCLGHVWALEAVVSNSRRQASSTNTQLA